MRRKWCFIASFIAMTLLLASCGSEQSSNGQMTYKDMKSMVIDILKTEEAQKAMENSKQSSGGGSGGSSTMSSLSVKDQEEVRLAVKDVLVSPDYSKVIKGLMTDTKFAGEFAKALNKENKDIHKELIKDPDYQSSLIKTFDNPDMEKLLLETLKGSQYRKEVMTIMQEAIQTPIFRLEIYELLKSAVKEELAPKSKEQEKQSASSGSSESGGGESGGGEGENSGQEEQKSEEGSGGEEEDPSKKEEEMKQEEKSKKDEEEG